MLRVARFTRLMLVVAAALQGSAAQANLNDPITITDRGVVRGTSSESMLAFRGIPYAAADKRFKGRIEDR